MLGNENLVAPYLEWAVATEFAYLPGKWFRMLLEVEESVTSFILEIKRLEAEDFIVIPSVYETPPSDLTTEITFCMAIMSREALETLVIEKEPGAARAKLERTAVAKLASLARRIRTIELGTPINMPVAGKSPPKKLRTTSTNQPQKAIAKGPPQKVIVGVIDDGLAFAHERFRFSNGDTRFKFFFNQDDGTISAPGPGRELTDGQINLWLAQYKYANIVDEDRLYQLAGQNLTARRAKHGTHVMDIACGLDPQQAGPDSPYLIGVQLPKWVTEETSGALLTPAVNYAITYILHCADQIAAVEGTPLPVVINLSYGTIAGPHDGNAPLELAIDQWIAARPTPLRVVLPAGNHYLARCHSRFGLAAATSPNSTIEKLYWRVQPDDKANSFMEIWLPELTADGTRPQIAVRITTPTGDTSPWIAPANSNWSWPSSGNMLFRATYDFVGRRPMIFLSMAPTAGMTASPRTAPSGTWLVEIENQGSAVVLDAWVQRGDTPFGYPLWGRQSRFDDSRYQRFDVAGRPQEEDTGPDPNIAPSSIHRRGTINALATGQRAIVVGGFRRSDCHPSSYSGAGPVATPPIVPPPRYGPDAAAVADDSVALHGVLAAGTRTGSVVAMAGTSVAAPQITRLISELMASGLATDRAAIQYIAASDPCPPPPGPSSEQRIGAGRIERPPRVRVRWKRWQ